MKSLLISIAIMSFALKTSAQSSIIFGVDKQSIESKAQASRFDPIGIYFGYEYLKEEKLLGWRIIADYNMNRYSYKPYASEIINDQRESRNVMIKNDSYAFGGGPALYLDISDDFQLKVNPMIFIASVHSKGTYSTEREYLTKQGTQNKYTTNNTIILNQQQHLKNGMQPYFKLMAGIDWHLSSNNTLGVEAGWQTINFGKTMNKLSPEKEFATEKKDLHTSQLLAGLTFKFR